MHASLVKWALCLGVLGLLGGGCALLGLFIRRLGSGAGVGVRCQRAVRRTFSDGVGGWLSLATMLLGALALSAGIVFLPHAASEQAVSSFSAPQGDSAAAPTTQLVTVAVSEENAPDRGRGEVSVNAAMSTRALQAALIRAPRGANIVFDAGTYNIANTIDIPCNDLHLTGPAVTPASAVLAASFNNADIFAFTTGCAALGSIRYLHFENTGAVYFGGGDNSNFLFENNQVTNLPSGLSNGGSEAGLFFDGSLQTTLKNVLIRHNTFGDPRSCTAVFATPKDEGGYCSGVITSQGEDNNIRIEYNQFFHVENGVHFNQLAQWKPGNSNSVCISCAVQYNYIANYHRIGIEIQTSTPTNSILVEHNAIVDPIGSSWGTFAVSMACCQWGRTMATPGYEPGYIFNDNVLIATLPIGSECPPYGVEFWGNGPRGMNSLIQGTFCHGYTWGFGAGSWTIHHNYICGADFAAKGGYITDQQKQGNAPRQTDNVIAAKCTATPSTAPTISPAPGSFSGSRVITLADPGLNTGIWYTTDGSTPVPGSGTAKYYTGPFTITASTTVKAVGMWGALNQPVSYPAGYGYIPSSVVMAVYNSVSSLRGPQPRAGLSAQPGLVTKG